MFDFSVIKNYNRMYQTFVNKILVRHKLQFNCITLIIFRSFSLDYDIINRPKFYRKLQPYIPLGDTVSFFKLLC